MKRVEIQGRTRFSAIGARLTRIVLVVPRPQQRLSALEGHAADLHGGRTFSRQQGSALSEVILLMFVLAPLLYAVVVVGKFVGVRQQSVVGARYLAWEHTVGSESSDAAASVQDFMGVNAPDNAMPPPVAGSRLRSGELLSIRPLRYRDDTTRLGSTQVTIGSVSAHSEGGNSIDATFAPATGVEAATGVMLGGGSSPSGEGLVQATLDVGIDDHPWLGDWLAGCADGQTGNACLSESSSVYLDDWSAADDEMAIGRIQTMVPVTTLQPLGETLSLVGRLPLFEELTPLDSTFGHVDMSVLPESRKALNGAAEGDQADSANLDGRSADEVTP